MIGLAVLYAAQDAPFLFAVQIIVYTGAIMMLFLFVLMLVGVETPDSLGETIQGQRLMAFVVVLLFGSSRSPRSGRASPAPSPGSKPPRQRQPDGLAELLFGPYVLAFELTSALLITAALAAMVLAHREQLADAAARPTSPASACATTPSPASTGQPADAGRLRPPQRGRHPCSAAGRRPLEESISASLVARGQLRDGFEDDVDAMSASSTSGRDGETSDQGGRGEVTEYLTLSLMLFTIGAAGVLVRRNAIVVFMCVELMLNATNLAFVTFSRQHGNLDGQVAAFFVMVVAAAEVVVGLAIIVSIYRTRRSASVDDASLLKL